MPQRRLLSVTAAVLLALLGGGVVASTTGLPRAAGFHLLLAAGIMPLIFTAMLHFVPVLTRGRGARATLMLLPPAALAAGLGAVVGLAYAPGLLAPAAGLALSSLALLLGWIEVRRRACLGPPHPGLHWYRGALACLVLGLTMVPVMQLRPETWGPLRALHLHLNLLGFVGLTALGTLQVLLPTARGRPDPKAALRLRRDLPLALAGSVLVALGAALWPPLSWAGAGLWLLAWGRFAVTVPGRLTGAALPLATAVAGLGMVLLAGLAHGLGSMEPARTYDLLFLGFLFPLVSGALGWLLPLWRWPGGQRERQQAVRARLNRWTGVRGLLFVGCGVLGAAGQSWAWWPALVGLAWFAGWALVLLWRPAFQRKGGGYRPL